MKRCKVGLFWLLSKGDFLPIEEETRTFTYLKNRDILVNFTPLGVPV